MHKVQKKQVLAFLMMFLALFGFFMVLSSSVYAADNVYEVYYRTGDHIYKTRTDGKGGEVPVVRNVYSTRRMKAIGKYLVGFAFKGNSQFVRLDLETGKYQVASSVPSMEKFEVNGHEVFFSTPGYSGKNGYIYRYNIEDEPILLNNKPSTVIETANMLDKNYLDFMIADGYLYYNALKDGRETWVARKKIDGSGSVTWICKGAIESHQQTAQTTESFYFVVNTKPTEQQYSTKSVVIYKVNRKTGKGQALNANKPIDVNASYTGNWAGDIFYYSNGAKVLEFGEYSDKQYMYDMSQATGEGISMSGRAFTISKNFGIYEMEKIEDAKYAFADGAFNVYTCNIQSGKISNLKKTAAEGIYYLWNIKSQGKRQSTLIAGSNGTYVLNDNASIKKLTGVEWQTFYLVDDMDGYLYANAGDEEKLYYLSGDTKTNRCLTQSTINGLLYVKKVS